MSNLYQDLGQPVTVPGGYKPKTKPFPFTFVKDSGLGLSEGNYQSYTSC